MGTRIVFNGREYASPEAMPADVREAYDRALAYMADADRNGIPDVLQDSPAAGHVLGIHHSSINVNGRSYDNVDEMPPAVRRLYEDAMTHVDRDRDGIPDALRGGSPADGDPEVRAHLFRREFTWGAAPGRRGDGTNWAVIRGSGLLKIVLAVIGFLALLYLLA